MSVEVSDNIFHDAFESTATPTVTVPN